VAFTVTATPGGASWQRGIDLKVLVLTNAAEAGGATSGAAAAGAPVTPQGSLTPNASSSLVAFAITADGLTTMAAAAANNTYDYSPAGHSDTWVARHGHYTGTVTAATPLTYGASSGTGDDHENHCAYEIESSGGTVTIDGSSPAGVQTDTGTTNLATASFAPPVGSVLVALVAAGGSGTGAGITCTMSDSSGTGMVWTKRAQSSTSDNFQVTFVFTATVPPATAPFTRSAQAQTSRTWQRRWNHFTRPAIPAQVQQVTVRAGVATASASAMAPPGFGPFIYKLGGTGYNSWFADQQGNPRLMLSEQAWALPWNAGRWNSGDWQSDFTAYFAARSAQGYNAWFGIVWGNSHVDSAALTGGRSWDGVYPLTVNGTPGAIATGAETVALNGTFWSRIDAFIATAMKYGTAVFMNLSMSYDISDVGGIWQNATNTQATAFGNALASRYPVASWPNLHWFFGDDDDGPNDSFYAAILTGIHNAGDTRPLISIEQFTNTNCHVSFSAGGAFSGSFGAPNATYNFVYSYDAPYFGTEVSYTEGGSFAHIPPTYGDGLYYGDTGSGTTPDRAMRTFAWWALASGSRGFTATSGPSDLGGGGLWTWQSGAVGRLTSDPNGDGTWCTSVAGAVRTYLTSLPDWHKLIPDTGNVFITAGRGTRGTCDAAGGVFNFRNTNNYVAGSITPAGTLAVIYCKAAMSITIDQTKMGSGYTATWVDPASLATQGTTTGTTYASSGLGNNSAGDPDWVLVLQGPPAGTGPAGVATSTAAAPAPAVAVTVTAGVATATATAPAPAHASTAASGIPAATATAPGPVPALTAASGVPAATAAAPAPQAAAGALAGVAPGSAVAPAATASTPSGTSAPAGVATAVAAALAPSAAITATAAAAVSTAVAPQPAIAATALIGAASATAAAPTATVALAAQPAAARATATAPAPAPAVTVAAGAAAVLAIAPAAAASTSGSTNAPAGAAAAAAVAPAPLAAVAVRAEVAAATATAPAATGQAARLAPAGVAAAAGFAPAPVLALASVAHATAAAALAVAAAPVVSAPAAFTVGTLTSATAPAATLTAASAAGGAAGGTITSSTQRTGGPS
jgi:Protein of unknown function (DUF4038)